MWLKVKVELSGEGSDIITMSVIVSPQREQILDKWLEAMNKCTEKARGFRYPTKCAKILKQVG